MISDDLKRAIAIERAIHPMILTERHIETDDLAACLLTLRDGTSLLGIGPTDHDAKQDAIRQVRELIAAT